MHNPEDEEESVDVDDVSFVELLLLFELVVVVVVVPEEEVKRRSEEVHWQYEFAEQDD